MFQRINYALVLLMSMAMIAACAPLTPQQHLEKAVSYMQKGDSELIKAEGQFDEGSASSATSHFNNAVGEYNKAVEQLSAATLPEGNDDTLKALKQGLNEAQAALEALEKEDYNNAEAHHMKARSAFATAMNSLN